MSQVSGGSIIMLQSGSSGTDVRDEISRGFSENKIRLDINVTNTATGQTTRRTVKGARWSRRWMCEEQKMGIITDAVSSALGLSSSGGWGWQSHIHQASFCGVPFGVIAGEGVYGRRVAVHEYPYRDTVWVEDLGAQRPEVHTARFLIQDSLVYSAAGCVQSAGCPGGGL
ncbi:DNA circularization N-terminal domain-containing protein [Escherichia coli]|uniref:DNA circularization N-terminal domain-containing protein n=1 Tax=Escherichia coli TaxID=562 RepID=UPI0039A43448